MKERNRCPTDSNAVNCFAIARPPDRTNGARTTKAGKFQSNCMQLVLVICLRPTTSQPVNATTDWRQPSKTTTKRKIIFSILTIKIRHAHRVNVRRKLKLKRNETITYMLCALLRTVIIVSITNAINNQVRMSIYL